MDIRKGVILQSGRSAEGQQLLSTSLNITQALGCIWIQLSPYITCSSVEFRRSNFTSSEFPAPEHQTSRCTLDLQRTWEREMSNKMSVVQLNFPKDHTLQIQHKKRYTDPSVPKYFARAPCY
jgi:hypothetical protein